MLVLNVSRGMRMLFTFPRRFARHFAGMNAFCLAGLVVLALPPLAGTRMAAQTGHPGAQITLGSGFSLPFGVAVDAYGNVFVADQGLNAVKEIVAAGGYTTINTIAGGFNQPVGLAFDGAGNLFVADSGNNAVKEILAASGYTTVNTLISGLNGPIGVAVDGNGNVFIANTLGNTVLELLAVNGVIPPSPTVLTLGSGFFLPYGVAVDTSGNVFVSDDGNNEVKEMLAVNGSIPASPVIHILGSGFNDPYQLSIDGSGNVFVADTDNSLIKEILAVGGYTTIETLGSGFFHPSDAVADAKGNVYVADRRNSRVEEILADGRDFGSVNVGSSSATPLTLYFTFDTGGTLGSTAVLTQGAVGLDFTDAGTGTCAAGAGYNAGDICTVNVTFRPTAPGVRYGAAELLDGTGNLLATSRVHGTGLGPQVIFANTTTGVHLPSAQTTLGSGFYLPFGVAVDGNGNVFVAEQELNAVMEIVAASGYTTVKTLGSGFNYPTGVAVDGGGNVFVADYQNSAVKEIVAAGGYTTVITLGSGFGFNQPIGVAVDGSGNVYVADTINNLVEEIVAVDGRIKTLGSGFSFPYGVAVDGSGNVYVADYLHQAVKEIVAVNGSIPASPTIKTLGSGFGYTSGVAVDGSGNVFVAQYGVQGVQEILAVNGSIPASPTIKTLGSGFAYTSSVAVDGNGNVFVADRDNSRVLKLDYADPPGLRFNDTFVGTTSTDSPQTVEIANSGNQPLNFASVSYPTDFPEFSNDPNACAGSTSLTPGQECDLPVSFAPLSAASLSENVILTDNALNAAAATQSIDVTGTGVNTPTVRVASASIQYGATPTMLTAALAYAGAQVPSGVVTIRVDSFASLTATCTGSLSPRTCSVSYGTGKLAVGRHTIAAWIASDAHYSAATKTSTLTVVKSYPAVTVPPVSISYGKTPTKLTASVSYAGARVPSGVVTIRVDSAASLTATCTGSSSPRTCSVSYGTGTLAVGRHTITAWIASDAHYRAVTKTGTLTVIAH